MSRIASGKRRKREKESVRSQKGIGCLGAEKRKGEGGREGREKLRRGRRKG
jgi:hypothetical protein